MKVSLNVLAGALAASCLLCAGVASATVFDFSYSFPAENEGSTATAHASGTFTATAEGGGAYLVTGASGTWYGLGAATGETITGMAPPGSSSLGEPDNLIFPTQSPVLDGDGLTFLVSGEGNSGDQVNVYYYSPSEGVGGYTEFDPNVGYSPNFTLTLASVPEPSAWALMGLGFATLGAGMRLRRSVARVAA
jgi:hypothetical protein